MINYFIIIFHCLTVFLISFWTVVYEFGTSPDIAHYFLFSYTIWHIDCKSKCLNAKIRRADSWCHDYMKRLSDQQIGPETVTWSYMFTCTESFSRCYLILTRTLNMWLVADTSYSCIYDTCASSVLVL